MTARSIPDSLSQLGAVIRRQAFPPYTGYPFLRTRPELHQTFLARWLAERIRRSTCVTWLRDSQTRPIFLALVERDRGASPAFGYPMARMTLWGRGDEDSERRAIRLAIRKARAQGIRHVSCRVDARETEWRRRLVEIGFYGVDTLASYVIDRSHPMPHAVRWGVRTRPGRPSDAGVLARIAGSAFRWDRFHSDPFLPTERSDRVYARWARQCCNKREADHVRVGIRGGRIAGFVAHRKFRELERFTGLRMYGQGLGAALPGAGDVYLAVLTEEFRNVWDRMDWIEIETQVQNHSHIRLLTKLGFVPLRTSMTYHRRLGK